MLLIGLAHAVPLALPPGEDPAVWEESAMLAGFELDGATGESWARLEAGGDEWILLVRDTTGAVRTVGVPAPSSPSAREDLVFLASSLLEPLDEPEPEPVGVRPPTQPVPEPQPEPVIVEPVILPEPEPEPEPVPLASLGLRLDAGVAAAHSESLRPFLATRVGAELDRGSLGFEATVRPWSTVRDYDVTVRAGGVGAFADARLTESVRVGGSLGLGYRLYTLDQARWTGVVPVVSARAGWDRGHIGVYARVDADLRRVDVCPSATSRLRPVGGSAGLSVRK